ANAQGPMPPLPDSTGWGVHVLAVARDAQGGTWVGTYGQGIYHLSLGATAWQPIRHDSTSSSISWNYVQALAFGSRGEIWYGTVGNGWGLSTDGGKTWKNWEFGQLGPEWQYVAPNGIGINADTVYIATADGIKLTWNNGETWRVITDAIGATTAKDSVWSRIHGQYVTHLSLLYDALEVHDLGGMSLSEDGGRKWKYFKATRGWGPSPDNPV